MAYTTGSGSWSDLIDDIVTHAVADGWTESDGIGTGFPLEINSRTYIDTGVGTTENDSDFTTGVDGGSGNRDIAVFCLGTDAADATANVAADIIIIEAEDTGNAATIQMLSGTAVANVDYTITNYWIFSDSASGTDYIHVVFQFSNGTNDDVYQHFSLGEIDKGSFTYTNISYTSSRYARGFAESAGSGNSALDWNSVGAGCYPFAGGLGQNDWGFTTTRYIITGTSPVDSVAGYPAVDTVHDATDLMYDATRIGSTGGNPVLDMSPSGYGTRVGTFGSVTGRMPFTAAISFNIFPMILGNGTGTGNSITWCGTFPNVRSCSMEDYSPGDEITFSGDTWKIFPWLRKTDNSVIATAFTVTSGEFGLAYKKVV